MPASRPIWKGQLRLSLVAVATTLIEKETARFDAAVFKDQGKKVSTRDEPAESRPSGSNVVDLMAALKSSLEGSSGSATKSSSRKPAARKPAAKAAPRKKAS